ncbi:MAG TPA: XdhC family protein [Candidatus Angelobacter sp.]
MLDQFLKQSAELLAKGETFAVATVVRCQPPTSGKPGDKAIIYADGKLWGWIGGGCAQPVVIREALKAMADGKPRLVRISPSADGTNGDEGVVDYTMTCHSGGALDIYIEPMLPGPHILILGRSPVARTLAQLGRIAGYAVSVVAPELAADAEGFADAQIIPEKDFNLGRLKITPQTYVVVSTQGEGDEAAVERAADSGAGYIAFVASKTKAAKVIDYLREKGMAADKLGHVRAPAGLDLGAATPEEIAVSILAEIVQLRRRTSVSAKEPAGQAAPSSAAEAQAKDSICGMVVDKSKARYKSEYQGNWFYFCCAGCKQKFDQEPAKHAARANL